ncbi:hypothetical protein [Actibacterium sp. 188UL27-1]|uniref:hypothetical protein n=1 Tax=Actibacterium sp. 188UL27-1 TaxID=2786961 RepID=UPI00195766F3|nr:hypothetical protein [Actibacterium sp. 188UL27-1]MBM7067594.1 hypothetical protein [Actibacterium sp. 188UL27-1]
MRVLSLIVLLAPFPAAAESLFCVFKTECLNQEACATTEYGFEIIREDGVARIETPAETLIAAEVEGESADVHAYATPLGPSGVHLVTVFAGGAAVYTNHTWFDEPFAITYHGSCEGDL